MAPKAFLTFVVAIGSSFAVAESVVEVLDFNFTSATIASNNLGNLNPTDQGGDAPPNSLTYVWEDGTVLSFTNTTEYKTNSPERNGLWGHFASVHVQDGTCVNLQATITMPEGRQPSFYFSAFDIDGTFESAKHANKETITLKGYRQFFVSDDAKIEIGRSKDTTMKVTSVVDAGPSNNPSNPYDLTEEQQLLSITWLFVGRKQFDMELCVIGTPSDSGRIFMFGGSSSLAATQRPRCAGTGKKAIPQVQFNFENVVVEANNLGGAGPRKEDPEAIVLGKVGDVGDRPIDLIVTAESPYEASKVAMNGVRGSMGEINLKNDRNVTLLFMFSDWHTNEEMAVSNFIFGFYDFDNLPGGEAREVLTVFEKDLDFRAGKHVNVTKVSGGVQFSSQVVGSTVDNPTRPDQMTQGQKDKGVTLLFKESSRFRVNFQVLGGPKEDGRNFEFSAYGAPTGAACGVNTVTNHEPRGPARKKRKFLETGLTSLSAI